MNKPKKCYHYHRGKICFVLSVLIIILESFNVVLFYAQDTWEDAALGAIIASGLNPLFDRVEKLFFFLSRMSLYALITFFLYMS